jgi:hypothetical protein
MKGLLESALAVTSTATKLTREELIAKADAKCQAMGLTKAQIFKASLHTNTTRNSEFIRVFLKWMTDDNQFCNIYFNDNATVSFKVGNTAVTW